MSLALIGISHKTAEMAVRERFSFTKDGLIEGLTELKAKDSIDAVVILSTCNRMEVYIHLSALNALKEKIIPFLSDTFLVREEQIRRYFYTLTDTDVITHLFKVASGLDSQILGETQILGQVRSAWGLANQTGTICGLLDELFIEAVNVGREVRALTKISQGNVSIGSVAMKMLEEQFVSIQDKSIMVIGTGKIGSLVCNYLKENNVLGIFVSNRTYAKARQLAFRCRGKAVNFKEFKEELKKVDILISSTSSPHLILSYKTLLEVMGLRDKPLLIMDLALPRDIDPRAKFIPGISLFTLDDLTEVVEKNYEQRQREAGLAEQIIQKKVRNFLDTKYKEIAEKTLNYAAISD